MLYTTSLIVLSIALSTSVQEPPHESAAFAGLKWLAAQQQDDGSWPVDEGRDDDHAEIRENTALALLAFLGAGQTPESGPYKNVVDDGLTFLIETAGKTPEESKNEIQSHALATFVICEAYAVTGEEALKDPVQRGIKSLVAFQNDDGGWGNMYKPELFTWREKINETIA